MLDDGVYGLTFETTDPERPLRGEGIAVVRDGEILGSDPHGGLFRGRYRYDAARGATAVEVTLDIPPNGELVTGLTAGPDGISLDLCAWFERPGPVSSTIIDIAGVPLAVEFRYVGALARQSRSGFR